MKSINKYFSLAREISKHSNYKVRVGAVVIKGNRILSVGHNQVRYKSRGLKYTKFKQSLHAERDAISKLDKSVLKGASIFVYREHNVNKTPMLAKPCDQCWWLIEEIGIKRIYFTIPEKPYYEMVKL